MDPLIADELQRDPRVVQARKLLREAITEVSGRLTKVRPARPDRKQSYDQMLNEIAEYRGSSLFFPFLGSGIGHGPLVELADGSVKWDFINGIGVQPGHMVPELFDAILDAALSDTIMQGNLQQNVDSLKLMRRLIELSGRDHCFLSTSGAMANINALKLAFYNKTPRRRLLAFERCFAGRSITLGQVTDKPHDRAGLPETVDVDYLPFGDKEGALRELRRLLQAHPGQYAAMFFELVQGEGGFRVGNREFFVALMEELRRHDIAIIIDEIQTFGRTHHLFAFQHFGLEEYADIVTFGKLSQVCGTLYQKAFHPPRALLGQTFTSSTSAIRTSLSIIDHLIKEGHYGNKGKNEKLHSYFEKGLRAIEKRHPDLITGPYGIGGMVACTPLDGDPKRVLDLIHRLFDEGLICFSCGRTPLRLRFLLPLISVTHEAIDEALEILERCLTCS